jgi:cytochrome P450
MPDDLETSPIASAHVFSRDAGQRYRTFAQLRETCPMHRLPGGELFAVSHKANSEGLRNVEYFSGTFSDSGALNPEDVILAGIPEPKHSAVRRIFLSALTDISRHEPFIQSLTESLVDDTVGIAARDGVVDLMAGLARPLPSAVIARLLGLPTTDVDQFARWTDELLDRQGSATNASTALVDLHEDFAAYLRGHIEDRQQSSNPPDDVITRFVQSELDGARLSVRAVQTQMMFFIVAGNGTTRDLIGNLLLHLASDPALFRMVQQDRTLIPAVIEEVLRVDSPVQMLARNCVAEITLDGTPVKPGERVLFSIASANRDARVWSDPDTLRPNRDKARAHLAFGAGPHICPAAGLARLEARIAAETLLDRVDALAFPPDHALDLNPVVWANGPQTLRVKLVPREPR